MVKRIGIDARLYFQTGVGTYLRNLLSNLQRFAPGDYEFYIYILKDDESKIRFEKKNFIKRPVSSLWHTFSEQTRFLYEIYKDRIDLMHFTYFSYPILYKRPFISTIHDTTPLSFKTGKASTKSALAYEIKHKVFKAVLKSQVKNAIRIITPTKAVKKQLVHRYGISYEEKIMPIYEGIDQSLQKAPINYELTEKYRNPFFIYVGNFYPHKNVETLVKAFSKLKNSSQLILIGPDDYFSHRLQDIIDGLNQNQRIIFCHNAKSSDLKFFYSNAQALIHPSYSEGFGLPVIEASYFNCPVIASNIDVFKELLKDEYIAFDPYSEEDIRSKIEGFVTKKPVFDYKHIIVQYSFEEMTKETMNIYRSCV